MPSAMLIRRAVLILGNILLPVAVLCFASGFFPYKPMIPGLATFSDVTGPPVDAPFDRVVFMVVDALRSDFVYGHGSGFEFTQSLIQDGAGIPFTAHATPPTVTMPRVKALTTGSVPSFLDFILNFAESDTSSSLASQDTWLAQLRLRREAGLVFYGDDTWLKLFPGDFFSRHDGTSSFFVSDFTEVDHNVTRHLSAELARTDWNALIMHYLGMDHIGHKTGPQGPNMLPKQKEMDHIVRRIYEALERKEHEHTLLILAGDHGMNAGGNHGGSGPGETEPALLFVSPIFKQFTTNNRCECPTLPRDGTQFHFYSKLEQNDVVPTMAALLGFPVPKNSIGVLIPELLAFWSEDEQIRLLEQNAKQLSHIVSSSYGNDFFSKAVQRHRSASHCADMADLDELACKRALSQGNGLSSSARIERLYNYVRAAQSAMSSTASSYNIPYMAAGIAVAFLSLILSVSALSPRIITTAGVYLSLLTALYGVMMFASSYVEEEQHLWYWITPAWFAILTVRAVSAAKRQRVGQTLRVVFIGLALLLVHRLTIRWNQTGQKHAGEPDIAHMFFPEHHSLMWLLILVTYMGIAYRIAHTSFQALLPSGLGAAVAAVSILPAIIFKLNFAQADSPELVQGLGESLRLWTQNISLVLQARIVFSTIAVLLIMVLVLSISKGKSSVSFPARLQPLLSLFLATQTRASNVPLLLLMGIQASVLSRLFDAGTAGNLMSSHRALDVGISNLLLSHTTFFCFGGSNSVSTLDLSHAYNGVADYNILAVGILLFASNWTGPVWWTFTSVASLLPGTASRGLRREAAKAAKGRSWVVAEHEKLQNDALAALRGTTALHTNRGDRFEISEEQEAWLTYMATTTIFIAASLVAVMAACTALRTHLFIWTVFSPKYLYAMAWTIGWQLLVNGIIGSTLWLFVSS